MLMLIKKGDALTVQNIEYVMSLVDGGEDSQIAKLADANCICITSKGRPVKAKTLGQQKYIDAIKKCTIFFSNLPSKISYIHNIKIGKVKNGLKISLLKIFIIVIINDVIKIVKNILN